MPTEENTIKLSIIGVLAIVIITSIAVGYEQAGTTGLPTAVERSIGLRRNPEMRSGLNMVRPRSDTRSEVLGMARPRDDRRASTPLMGRPRDRTSSLPHLQNDRRASTPLMGRQRQAI